MDNRFDELFFNNDSSDKPDLENIENKINWRRCALSVFFGVIAMSSILAGIFCSSFIDSIISITALALIAVMSAMDYK